MTAVIWPIAIGTTFIQPTVIWPIFSGPIVTPNQTHQNRINPALLFPPSSLVSCLAHDFAISIFYKPQLGITFPPTYPPTYQPTYPPT